MPNIYRSSFDEPDKKCQGAVHRPMGVFDEYVRNKCVCVQLTHVIRMLSAIAGAKTSKADSARIANLFDAY